MTVRIWLGVRVQVIMGTKLALRSTWGPCRAVRLAAAGTGLTSIAFPARTASLITTSSVTTTIPAGAPMVEATTTGATWPAGPVSAPDWEWTAGLQRFGPG